MATRAPVSRAGLNDLALQSYQSAVEQIEAIRQDIPVEYVGTGARHPRLRSSRSIWAWPTSRWSRLPAPMARSERSCIGARAKTVRLIKQTELQDYLGDRCRGEHAAAQRLQPAAGVPPSCTR